MNWDRFNFEYVLDERELFTDLIAIEAYKQASLNLICPQEWRDQLDRLNRVRAVHGTTAIEGNPLSEDEVSRQMEFMEENTVEEKQSSATKEQLQVRNAGEAQSWVRERFNPGSRPLDLEDILRLHEMITQDSDTVDNTPGRLRGFSVTVGTPELGGIHRGAPYDRLSDLMRNFLEFINLASSQKHHPVVQALLAHFFLVTIHPFGDGNGRVSRLVEAAILYRHGYNVRGFYGLSNYFYRHETEYKTVLQQCRHKQPFYVSPFIRFGVKGFSIELKGINNFIKARINRLVYRNMMVKSVGIKTGPRRRLLNEREYGLLVYLLDNTEPQDPFADDLARKVGLSQLWEDRYLRSLYRRVSLRTFQRELTRLAELGFIHFTKDDESEDWIVELDFGAIEKY